MTPYYGKGAETSLDAIKKPFTPRVPIENYYRFQAIELERHKALIESGKF